jgi:hypothetical protein
MATRSILLAAALAVLPAAGPPLSITCGPGLTGCIQGYGPPKPAADDLIFISPGVFRLAGTQIMVKYSVQYQSFTLEWSGAEGASFSRPVSRPGDVVPEARGLAEELRYMGYTP